MVSAAINTVHRIWPKAAVALALVLNSVWIVALGYVRLLADAFLKSSRA
jgi:hypothetical protein